MLREVVSRSGFANGPVNKAHLHVVPHCALGQVGEGAEFIKTESFGHEPILTLKLFKSSVNINLICSKRTEEGVFSCEVDGLGTLASGVLRFDGLLAHR